MYKRQDSASAAEIVSAALQDAGVASVIGTRSYGKGTIQEILELPCNSGVLLMTTASFWRPSGVPINRDVYKRQEFVYQGQLCRQPSGRLKAKERYRILGTADTLSKVVKRN